MIRFKKSSASIAVTTVLAAAVVSLTAGPAVADTPAQILCYSTEGLAGVSTFGQAVTFQNSSLFHTVGSNIKDTKGGDGNRAGLRIKAWHEDGSSAGTTDLIKDTDRAGTQFKDKDWTISQKIYKIRVYEMLVNKQGEKAISAVEETPGSCD
jgi:hypothetical protein